MMGFVFYCLMGHENIFFNFFFHFY
ncbi:hypothetical protein RUM_16900 [Ruminococcus champanellensis 18P13 = JCM 17042]|uniref:Uncharacterized protein n=1 Tax=Ruminococcus champanellensis (strain DSM 18848 / JCM 17042 / KCTC 15320 / 18P13) TaxID=213810 RepID=D4LDS2_RUMC1|nr:hypothetical protein RUM_16900 [Ruminococcus champanellensis 18P13 = JCM 17042]